MPAFPITQTFDPSIGEYGQDYALAVGTPIYSPISGTVGTEDQGKQAWGKRVLVFASKATQAATGVGTFAVGHLTKFAVSAGQTVSAGQLLGYSGGATSDPSSGNSSGPHVEPQFFSPATGLPVNPLDIFKQFTSWEQAIFGGAGALAGGSPAAGAVAAAVDPFAGISQAIGSASANLQSMAFRIAFGILGAALFIVGLFLIFAGDLEKLEDASLARVHKEEEVVAPAAEASAA